MKARVIPDVHVGRTATVQLITAPLLAGQIIPECFPPLLRFFAAQYSTGARTSNVPGKFCWLVEGSNTHVGIPGYRQRP
jgi:hypothetical protein